MSNDLSRDEARFLLTKAIGDEPPVSVDTSALLRRARRTSRLTNTAVVGGVVVGVAAALAGAVAMANTPEESTGVASATGSREPSSSTCVPPPDMACVEAAYTEDDRSHALTAALQGAQQEFLPAGLTATPRTMSWPGAGGEAFKVIRPTEPWQDLAWPYYATAAVGEGDVSGPGTVSVFVGDAGNDGRCASVDRAREEVVVSTPPLKIAEFAGCTDRTLDDGTLAAISTYRGRDAGGYTGQEGYEKIVVDAVRPDGTHLHLVSDNHLPPPPGTMTGVEPTRPEPPLDAEALLKIATIPDLKY